MKKSEKQEILQKLDWEGGYDYLVHGSDFKDFTKDKEFHAIRERIVSAYADMEELLGELEELEQ